MGLIFLPMLKPFFVELFFFSLEMGEYRSLVFLRQPFSVTSVAGQTVLLSCVVSGFPTPNIHWRHKQEEIVLDR